MRGVNRFAGFCASAMAVLTLGLMSAPGAFAAQVVTLKTAGSGALPDGSPLTATSTNAVLSTSGGGSVSCEESVLSGTLNSNQEKADGVLISSATFAGDYENIPGACKFSVGGPAVTEARSLPWKIELGAKGSAVIAGSVTLKVSFPDTMPEVSCVYEGKKLIEAFKAGSQMVLEFRNAPSVLREGDPKSCPESGQLTAAFAVTSTGEPVEAVIGSSEEVETPSSVSGTVSNAAAEGVEGVTVEACNEEEREEKGIHACNSAQTGAGGHYSIPNVAPGFYVLIATPPAHSGYGSTESEEFTLVPGEASTQNVQLRGTGSVSGTVSAAGGPPLAGIHVSMCEESAFGECFTATTTESAGPYSFPEVPAGSYLITASPAANSGYGRASAVVTVAEGQAQTENLELPEAGTVTGVVTEQNSNPVSGVSVAVCLHETCYQTQTDGFGAYTIEGVSDGEYVATVAPSGTFNSATSPKFTVTGTATSTVNLSVSAPVAPPAGTEMPGSETVDIGNNVNLPVFYWESRAPLKTTACVGGHVTATVTGTNTQTEEVQTISPVTLAELSPPGSGKFEGELPKLFPIHGALTIKIKVEGCQHPSEEEEKEFNAYVDPSGLVVDGNHADAPISGATVTLLAGAQSFSAFTAVPNGSTVMSPANRKNSDTTSAIGEFGWDTLPGWYEVEAHKAGCGSASTPAFQVPPPVTNLQLVLHCSPVLIETAGLPTAKREVHYETQLVAGGEDPPFKWKKKAALPKGLKLSKAGVLSGTMKRKKVQLGIYAIEVEVKDAAHHTTTLTLPLKVR